jgi:hypothetical protein
MDIIKWHRTFGLTLIDFFKDSNFEVELEKELSIKKQFLDIVIIKKIDGESSLEMPAGFDNLVDHNLLTYKSVQEPLDEWTIEELIGHYVNYRKLVSPSLDKLLPPQQFQLYALSTRYPQKLLSELKENHFKKLSEGVFDLQWGSRKIRLLVLSKIPLKERNAVWAFFTGKREDFYYGDQHYQWRDPRQKAVLNQLFELYKLEGAVMSYTVEDFDRDYTRDHLHLLPTKEVMNKYPLEDRLEGLPSEEVMNIYPPEERLKGLPPEERVKGLTPEERLEGLTPEELEKIQAHLLKSTKH